MRLVNGLLTLGGAAAFGQLMGLLASPLLTRLFSPEAFGVFSLFVAITSIFGVIAGARYELALQKAHGRKESCALIRLTLMIGIGFAVAVMCVIGVIRGGDLPILTELDGYLWLVPAGFFVFLIFNLCTFLGIQRKKYTTIAFAKIIQPVSAVGLQIGYGLLGFHGAAGLIFGYMFGLLLAALYLIYRLLNVLECRWVFQIDRGYVKTVFWRHIKFAKFSTPSAGFNSASLFAPSILIATFFSLEAAGLFEIARRIVNAPVGVLATAISQVFLGEIRTVIEQERDKVRQWLVKVMTAVLLLVGIPLALLFLAVSDYTGFVFGEEWRKAGHYMNLLIFPAIVQLAVSPVSQILNLIDRQELMLLFDVLRLSAIVTVFSLGLFWGITDVAMIGVYSAVMAAFYVGFGVLIVKVS